MSTSQQFFATLTVILSVFAIQSFWMKHYVDAKVETINARLDSMAKNIDTLVHYMIDNQGRLSTLEERTKNL